MIYNKFKLAAVLLFGLGLTGLHAQDGITPTGGNVSGSGGSVSYSVGQVVYQSHESINGSVMEGVQQLYEISIISAIEDVKSINILVTAYPNPTADYLTLVVKDFEIANLNFRLYDIRGKLLQHKKLTGTETQIDMGNYVPASYFVKILSESTSIKEFKIIKQ